MEKESKIYISTKEVEGRIPLDDSPAKVYITNHIIEIVVSEKKRRRGCAIRKINKDYYLVESTGEIKKFKEKSSKETQVKKVNMNGKFSELKRLINRNFLGNNNELHVVLTYQKGMFDRDKASDDFKVFWKYVKFTYPTLAYIVIYEPTSRGSWHMHILIKDNANKYLFISRVELERLWKKGYVYVGRIKENDDIGAYFVALISGTNNETQGKGKADRLKYYKKGYRLYSRSAKGIITPTPLNVPYLVALEIVKGLEPCFEKNYGIFSAEDDRELNVIYHKHYNLKRPNGIYEK